MNKKIISLLLAICMTILCAVPAFAATYPEGVSAEDATLTAQKLDAVLLNMVKQSGGKDLSQTVYSTLYSDETLNSVLASMFSSSSDMSALGIDMSKENIAKCLSEYPSVSAAILASPDLEHLNLEGAKWGVNSKQSLAAAIANIAEPFNDLLYFLLCSGSLKVSILTLPGDNGYKNGIMPMLAGFTVQNIMDAETFKANADARKNSMVENIAMMIFPLVDQLLAAPVEELCERIPHIAKFFQDGSFAEAMDGLLKPISIHVGDLITLVPATKMLSIVLWAQDSSKYSTDFNENITTIINEALNGFGLKVAEIDLDAFASCIGKTGDAFIEIMTWLIDTVKLNKDQIPEMLKESGTDLGDATEVMNKLLSKETTALLGLIIKLFSAQEGEEIDYQWTQSAFTSETVSYTTNLKEREFGRVVDGIDELLGEALAEGGEYKNITEVVRNNLYSNKTLTSLVVTLYSALNGEDMGDAMAMTGMDFSPSAVAKQLTERKFHYARNKLYSVRKWDTLKDATVNFGIRTGRAEDFEDALVAVLRPFAPALRMLLANGTLEVMGGIQIPGSNGYNSAIIPLLEAIGCKSEDILTYDQYKKQADGDGVIEGLLDPIMGILKKAEDNPIETILGIVPNFLKFINDGNLVQAIMNLLTPIENLLNEVGLTYDDLGINIEEIKNTDFLGQITEQLPEMLPDIKLDETPDIKKLANYGTAETRTSKATYQGKNYEYTYIVANKAAVMYVVMDFVIGIITKPENADMINNLMAGGNQDAGMFSQYSGSIGDSLSTMSKEECIEWLYRLFFHERIVVETTQSDYHPNIKYVKEDKFEVNYGSLAIICFIIIMIAVLCITNRGRLAATYRSIKENNKFKKENKGV